MTDTRLEPRLEVPGPSFSPYQGQNLHVQNPWTNPVFPSSFLNQWETLVRGGDRVHDLPEDSVDMDITESMQI